MIRAVFLDIDGTIISIKNHTIPQSAINSITRIRKKGVKVFLCTSRAKQFLFNIRNIEFDGIVALTGAHCIDKNGHDIARMSMNSSDIAAAIIDIQKNNRPLIALSGDKVYIEKPDSAEVREVLALGGLTTESLPGGVSKLPNFIEVKDPILLAKELHILQITCFFPSGDEDTRFMKLMPSSHTERWAEAFVDIVGNGTDKASGLKTLAAHYGFKLNEILAAGDGANDISMIKAAGIGVAMGNASDEVKKYADYITADVDENGLSIALEKFV